MIVFASVVFYVTKRKRNFQRHVCLLDAAAGKDGNSEERYMSVLCTPIRPSPSESPSGNPDTSQSDKCNSCRANLSYLSFTNAHISGATMRNFFLTFSFWNSSRHHTCGRLRPPRFGDPGLARVNKVRPTRFCHFSNTHSV